VWYNKIRRNSLETTLSKILIYKGEIMISYLKGFISSIMIANVFNLISPITMATESGDWLIRSRLLNINPNSDSDNVNANGSIILDSNIDVDDSYALDIDITYMIAKHWGLELFLDSSSKHTLDAKNHKLSSLMHGRIAETRMLPPALLLQYHLVPDATIRPYAGVGAHYALFFDEKASSTLDHRLEGVSEFTLDNSVGVVAQIGADYSIDNDWFFNVDLKYMTIKTSANFRSQILGKMSVDIDVDPWIIGFGMGRRF